MFVPVSQEVSSSESPQLYRRFMFSEIQLATSNFDESLVIGRGGFGKVYKGTITNGPNLVTVAVKRLDSGSSQGASEFWAEVNMLSNLRHCHLVSLLGYCNDGKEMILVYEYMSHGTLEDHLHSCQTPLSWLQRLAICIGAARGLDYLHTGTGIKDGVVHRDVKSSNILLDDSWAAKISDFGLSKICPKNQRTTYVNTGVKGTFGYLDLDYFYTGKLTRKTDVYAFGVVLFEVLCGKRAVDRSIHQEQWGLAAWAQNSIKEGRLKQIVDTDISGSISPVCLKDFAKLAKRCLHKHPKQRPTMAEVVVGLESVMALQQKANNTLKPTRMHFFVKKALMVIFPSNDKNSELTVGDEQQLLPHYDFETIKVATENFSKANRIQQPKTNDFLYKGKLQNGQGIAVSRIHCTSRYNLFTDEKSISVKIEHENVAKLLGHCIEGNNLFLVYEFALHATPDCLIFDPECTLLNWDKRYKILLGVARALVYLHNDAPIQIIHGDLKPGNILLDESSIPLLLGFVNTRFLELIKLSFVETEFFKAWRYKAPEYLHNIHVSTKADVYSFGVLVLEAITKRRTSDDISILEYVERNWLEGTLTDIIDPRIDVKSIHMTRFLEIGLLCVQADAWARPTMEEVVSMLLDSSSLALLASKIRQMVIRKLSDGTCTPVYNSDSDSNNDYDYDADEGFISELSPR